MKPLMYTTTAGKEVEIKDPNDLRQAIKEDFDPRKLLDEAHLGAHYAKAVQSRFADATAKGEPFVDGEFLRRVTAIRPRKEYYELTQGDRAYYLDLVHQLDYDIVEAVKIRKEKEHEAALA